MYEDMRHRLISDRQVAIVMNDIVLVHIIRMTTTPKQLTKER